MLDSYFFVPGDKPKYINKIRELKADFVILDLEDSVSFRNKNMAFDLVNEIAFNNNLFVRVPFFDKCFTSIQIKKLVEKFKGQIVLPKIKGVDDLKKIISSCDYEKLNMIVLIENASSFLEVANMLKAFSNKIYAIGFGTHDFCSSTGIKHSLDNLAHYKRQLILYAKAFNVRYIDGVDLDLDNFDNFYKECVFAFEAGANGKFLIHPLQLQKFLNIEFFSKEEIGELQNVYVKVKNIPEEEIDVIKINGKIYEKPHILQIKNLVEKKNVIN